MSLTRRKCTFLFRALGAALWLMVVFLVLFDPLTGRYITRWPKSQYLEEHIYTTLGNIPLLTVEYDVTDRMYFTEHITRIQPHFGVLFDAIIIVSSGIGCVILARWGARRLLIGCCDECGYDLQGIESVQCPECGASIVTA